MSMRLGVRLLITLCPQSGSRKLSFSILLIFSFFMQLETPDGLDGETHIQGGSPPFQLNHPGNTLMIHPEESFHGDSKGSQVVMKINHHIIDVGFCF